MFWKHLLQTLGEMSQGFRLGENPRLDMNKYPEAQGPMTSAPYPYQDAPRAGLQASEPSLIQTIGSLDPVLDRVNKIATALEIFADRLGGTAPSPLAEPSAPETPPRSVTDNLRRKILALNYLCDKGERELQRIHRLMGEN